MKTIDNITYTKLRELCTCRHNVHKANLNTNKQLLEHNLKRIGLLCNNIILDGVPRFNMTNKAEELLYYYDERDVDVFEEEKESLNSEIEEFLSEIDSVYGTRLCPEGFLRNQYHSSDNSSEAKRGMIFWCERRVNGLFGSDGEKNRKIPAIIISNDDWNTTHDSYVVLSIARKDDFVKDCEFNVACIINNEEHVVRCFNPFTVRRVHMGSYITSLNSDIMNMVEDKLAEFQGISRTVSNEELNLSVTIERIMREKSEKIKQEMVRESCAQGMQMILNQLNDLYPEKRYARPKESIVYLNQYEKIETIDKSTPIIELPLEEKEDVQQETIIQEIKQEEIVEEPKKKRKNNKWNYETAKRFLDDYGKYKNKKELAALYGFASPGSVYTRYERCKEIVGLI